MRIFVFGVNDCIFYRLLYEVNKGTFYSPLLRFLGFLPERIDIVGVGGTFREFTYLEDFLENQCNLPKFVSNIKIFDLSDDFPDGDVAIVYLPKNQENLRKLVSYLLSRGFNVIDFSGFPATFYSDFLSIARDKRKIIIGGFLVGYFDVFAFVKVFTEYIKFLGFNFEGILSVLYPKKFSYGTFKTKFGNFKLVWVPRKFIKNSFLSILNIFGEDFSFTFDILDSWWFSKYLKLIDLVYGTYFYNLRGYYGFVEDIYNFGYLEGLEKVADYMKVIINYFESVKRFIEK